MEAEPERTRYIYPHGDTTMNAQAAYCKTHKNYAGSLTPEQANQWVKTHEARTGCQDAVFKAMDELNILTWPGEAIFKTPISRRNKL
jgi:hypothetical protein